MGCGLRECLHREPGQARIYSGAGGYHPGAASGIEGHGMVDGMVDVTLVLLGTGNVGVA